MHEQINTTFGINEKNEWAIGVDDNIRNEVRQDARETRQNLTEEDEKLSDLMSTEKGLRDADRLLANGGIWTKTGDLIKTIGLKNFMTGISSMAEVVDKYPRHEFNVYDDGSLSQEESREIDLELTNTFIDTVRGQALVDGVSEESLLASLGFTGEEMHRRNFDNESDYLQNKNILDNQKTDISSDLAKLVYAFNDTDAAKIMEIEVPRVENENNNDYNSRVLEVKKDMISVALNDIEPKITEAQTIVNTKREISTESSEKNIDTLLFNSEEYKNAKRAMDEYNELLTTDIKDLPQDGRGLSHKHHKLNVAYENYQEASAVFFQYAHSKYGR